VEKMQAGLNIHGKFQFDEHHSLDFQALIDAVVPF
jgi:hypothetical protein